MFFSEHVSIRDVPPRGLCVNIVIICHSGFSCVFLGFVLKLRHCGRDAQIPVDQIFMVAANIYGSLIWYFLHTVLQAPRFLENLCTPALRYCYLCLHIMLFVRGGSLFVICTCIVTLVLLFRILAMLCLLLGYAVAQCLRHCVTNRKVAGSIPMVLLVFFH
jgi:hypothetical protein